MGDRGRLKPRRREISSYRYFHQLVGHRRAPAPRAATNVAPSRVTPEAPRVAARMNHRPVETRTILRLEGDSIAYFWALETETAISYDTLMVHWREFTNALTNTFPWD